MSTEEESRQEVYYIPQNFDDAGGVLGGRFTQRNGIEMAVVGIPILWINFQFVFPNTSLKTAIITLLLTAVPPVALCATGIGGESISQIAVAFFRFLKNRRYLSFICFNAGVKKGYKILPQIQAKNRQEHEDELEAPRPEREKTSASPSHMQLMNSALKERLLRKLELGDEEDMDL